MRIEVCHCNQTCWDWAVSVRLIDRIGNTRYWVNLEALRKCHYSETLVFWKPAGDDTLGFELAFVSDLTL